MVKRASIAFFVPSAEDEQAGGEWRARQNVMHETGLSQGSLGFSRALVVREEACAVFSNVDGLQEIGYAPGRLEDNKLEVLDTIEREFPSSKL